jgi:hypothetical protein
LAVSVLLFLVLAPYLYDRLLTIDGAAGIHFASAAFFAIAGTAVLLICALHRDWKRVPFILFAYIAGWTSLVLVAKGDWLGVRTLTDELVRVLLVVVPGSLIWAIRIRDIEPPSHKVRTRYLLLCLFASAFLVGWLIPHSPAVEEVVFDEAHGSWATVNTTYGPDDFGRNHSYTYSLLFQYSAGLTPTRRHEKGDLEIATNGLFVLKMPTEPLEEPFLASLVKWVRSGGRLLVIADHTDLFDTTQYLNAALSHFGIELDSTATFDSEGKPPSIRMGMAATAFGKVSGVRNAFVYQTGASFRKIPLTAIAIGTYGPSFAEHAVYFRPNRFGYFRPQLQQAFGSHASIVATASGRGVVVVLADSTPWSNFSMFQGAYKDLYRHLLEVVSNSETIRWYPFAILAASLSLLVLLLIRHVAAVALGAIAAGILLGCCYSIGSAALSGALAPRDYDVRVSLGSNAHTQALLPLLPMGELNYSRILSSLQKYGARLRVAPAERTTLESADAEIQLFIDPTASQLPHPDEVASFLRRGGRLSILFAPGRSSDRGVTRWLDALGLTLSPARGLAFAEQLAGPLEQRNGLFALRYVTHTVSALPTSVFHMTTSDPLGQTFIIRPIQIASAPERGVLAISFSADQFADIAMGEIWDGTIPPQLSRQRERQAAALVLGFSAKPELATHTPYRTTQALLLPNFIVLKNGTPLMEGRLAATKNDNGAVGLGSNPDAYLTQLQREAVEFVRTKCAIQPLSGFCDETLIASDLTEWVVAYRRDRRGIGNIELMHDRRFSGIDANYNVIFSRD